MAVGDTIYYGPFLKVEGRPCWRPRARMCRGGGISRRPVGLTKEQGDRIISRMM